MREEIIAPQTGLISSTQEEAVAHVQGAPVFGVTPDVFKQNRTALLPEVQKMNLPPTATPVVARNIAQSSEHAAAIAPDAEKLNWIERQWGNIANAVSSKVGDERRLIDLNWKKLRSGGVGSDQFTETDELDLMALRESAKQNFGKKDYGMSGTWESLPADVIAQGVDMVALAGRNAKTILGLTAAGTAATAATGALVGAPAGGVGAIPGAIAGAGIGFLPSLTTGYVVAAGIDAYQTTAASTYGELETAIDERTGRPLAVDARNKEYISHGVGIVSGALSVVTDKLMLKSVPFLKKLLTPTSVKELVLNPANLALKETIIGIGKSMAVNATEESLQEAVQIIGEEVGNTYQNGEVAFLNGLTRAAEKIKANEAGARERVGRAGLVGGVAGGALAGVGAAAYKGAEKVSKKINTPPPTTDVVNRGKTPPAQAVDVLKLQDVIDASAEVTKATKLKGLAPEMVSDLRKQIVTEAGISKVFLNKEDLNTNDPVKAERIRNAIDVSGVAASSINAPIKMDTHVFLDLVDEYPDLSEHVRLNPEGPSPGSARVYLENLQKAEAERVKIRNKLSIGEKSPEERAYSAAITPDMDAETIVDTLGSKEVAEAYLARLDVMEVDPESKPADIAVLREKVTALKDQLPDDVSAKQTLKAALELPQPENDVFNEADYLNQPTFTKAIENVLGEKEVETINKAQLDARMAVANSINEAATYEMNKVIDVVEAQALEVQAEIEMEKIANDPNIAISDRFLTPNSLSTHAKEGYSLFAIDPSLLSPEQKAKYAKDAQLKKHKAFVKGGISPDAAAELVGVVGGDKLLALLARTPTRTDAVADAVARKAAGIRAEAEANVNLNETSIAKAYHTVTSNHLVEMKYLLDEKWSSVKKGIKRIALPIPRIEELTKQAKNAIAQTKVGDLNANQFKVGERKSQRIAVKAVLDNDIEKAFVNKQAAALNSELTIATHQAIGEVNRVVKLVKRLESSEIRSELKRAGSLDAAEELLNHYSIRKSRSVKELPVGVNQYQGSFQSWVKKQVEAGNGNMEIPERLSDTRLSLEDMTVEEVKVVGDRLKSILKDAREKNFLDDKYGAPAQERQKLVDTVAKIHEQAITHIDYDENRTVVKQGDLSATHKAVNALRDLTAMVTNAEFILLNVDQNKVGGLAHEAILAPIKGVGKYAGQGESGKGADMVALGKHFDTIVEGIGQADWKNMQNVSLDIPEFKGNVKLNDGKLTLGNLFMMILNQGNEGNIQRMAENFGTDIETIRTVLDREMDSKYAVAAQRIMDTYKSYYPRVVKLHEEMTGATPEMVEAVPFTHKGKVYPGGYYPLNYAPDLSPDKIRKSTADVLAAMNGEKEFSLKDHFYTDDMTRHGHTEKRTANDQQVNLSMGSIGQGFEMILHDLNFRKPIANALKVVTDATVAKDITAIAGVQDYNVLVNTIVGAAGSLQMENTSLYNGTIGEQIIARTRSGLSAGVLAYNLGSIFIQPVSMTFAVKRMGATAPKHMLAVTRAILTDIGNYSEFSKFAGEIASSVRDHAEGINESQRDVISEKLPIKNFNKVTAGLQSMTDKVSDYAFKILGRPDQLMKVIVSMSAYRQFMEGDAEGYSRADVMKLSPSERDHQAKVYASSVVRMSLTAGSKTDRAQIQNQYKNVAMFFNDSRNIINNTLQSGREISQHIRRNDYGKAATETTAMFATLAAAKLIEDMVRGNPTPLTEGNRDEEKEAWLKYMLSAPVQVGLQSVPVVRDMNYAFNAYGGEKDTPVGGLYSKVGTDIVMTAKVAMNFMDIVQGEKTLRTKDLKAVGMTASYLTGGIPVIGAFKFVKYLRDGAESLSDFKMPLGDEYRKKLESFKKSQEEAEASEKISKEEMDALDAIAEQVAPSVLPVENNPVNEATLDN